MEKKDKQNWLAILSSSNSVGISLLYQEFLPSIVNLVTTNNGTDEEAMDVFQEAIIVVYKKSKEDDFVLSSSFFTYLYAVSKNIWLKRLTKKGKPTVTFSELPELMDEDDFNNTILEEERYRLFRSKFRNLSDNCRQLLSLFFKKTPMKEIVDLMGFGSVQYAKKRKFQCKQNLVKLVKSDPNFKDLV